MKKLCNEGHYNSSDCSEVRCLDLIPIGLFLMQFLKQSAADFVKGFDSSAQVSYPYAKGLGSHSGDYIQLKHVEL